MFKRRYGSSASALPDAAPERSQQIAQVFGTALAGVAQIALQARVRMEAVERHDQLQ